MSPELEMEFRRIRGAFFEPLRIKAGPFHKLARNLCEMCLCYKWSPLLWPLESDERSATRENSAQFWSELICIQLKTLSGATLGLVGDIFPPPSERGGALSWLSYELQNSLKVMARLKVKQTKFQSKVFRFGYVDQDGNQREIIPNISNYFLGEIVCPQAWTSALTDMLSRATNGHLRKRREPPHQQSSTPAAWAANELKFQRLRGGVDMNFERLLTEAALSGRRLGDFSSRTPFALPVGPHQIARFAKHRQTLAND